MNYQILKPLKHIFMCIGTASNHHGYLIPWSFSFETKNLVVTGSFHSTVLSCCIFTQRKSPFSLKSRKQMRNGLEPQKCEPICLFIHFFFATSTHHRTDRNSANALAEF